MTNLHIHSWHRNIGLGSLQSLTPEALLERLKPVAELTDLALTRLVRRLRARYPILLPLRADADVTTLVAWLTRAGAVVQLSAPDPSITVP